MEEELTGESASLAEFLADPAVQIVARLAKSPMPNDEGLDPATEIVECDFVGYEPVQLGNWDVFQEEDVDLGQALSPPVTFVAGDLIDPQVATGLYITAQKDDNAARLVRFFPFDPDFVFDIEGRQLTFQIRAFSVDRETISA